MNEKDKLFEEVLFLLLKDQDHYEKNKHMILEVRKHMCKFPQFKRLSIPNQFEQCQTIVLLIMATGLGDIKQISILRPPRPRESEYDVLKDFKMPDIISISNKKQLKNE